MTRERQTWLGLAAVAVALAGGLVAQHRAAARLAAEVSARRHQLAEHTRLAAEQARLENQLPSRGELEARREERAAVTQMLADLARMRARGVPPPAAPESLPPANASLRETDVPAGQWRDRGQGDPVSTLETALWAGRNGDLDRLGRTIEIDPHTQAEVDRYFQSLPANLRADLGSSEKLVALLTAKAMPLGSARVLLETPGERDRQVAVQLADEDGNSRGVLLGVHLGADGWRLVVPPDALHRYAETLRTPPKPGGG